MKKVGLIFGGMGSEAEVSRSTTKAFQAALDKLNKKYVLLEANRDLAKKLLEEKPDVVLLAVHGKYGEDGTLQGLLEYMKIPYSGSGVLSSSLSMDKAFTKSLLEKHEIPTAKYQVLDLHQTKAEKFVLELSYPIVVKPSRDGSSIGVSMVSEQKELLPAIKMAAEYDHMIILEKCIIGKEVTVPVMGSRLLSCIEIEPKKNFYNYENKYTAGKTEYIIPANIEEKTRRKINEISLKVCELFRVRSYARIDFMLDKKENPYVLEVNTLPGCTPTSLVPKAAAYDGIEFDEFISYLLESASLDYLGLK